MVKTVVMKGNLQDAGSKPDKTVLLEDRWARLCAINSAVASKIISHRAGTVKKVRN
jgi:uncharacterized protein YmfQ (DUF2313 family)